MLRPIGPLFLVDTHKRLLIVCVLQNQNKAKILSKMTGFQKGIGEFPNLLSFFKFLGFGFAHFAKKTWKNLGILIKLTSCRMCSRKDISEP